MDLPCTLQKKGIYNIIKYPLLAPLAQDLLSAPASQAYVEHVFSVCDDSTTGKRNRLTKKLEKRAFLEINYKLCLTYSVAYFTVHAKMQLNMCVKC